MARRRRTLIGGTYLLLTLVTLAVYLTGALRTSELAVVDAQFALRGTQHPATPIARVEIDSKSIGEVGSFPFPRSVHARLIDRLRLAGVRVIAYDIQFSEPTQVAQDNALIDAIRRAGNVVLATTEVDAVGRPNVLGGGGVVEQIHARAGNANYEVDRGSIIRHLPYSVAGLPSLAVTVAELATGRTTDPTSATSDHTWIDFVGPPGTIPVYSFSDVLRGRVPANLLSGRIIVVGAGAPSLQDLHATSVGSLMTGPELQANSALTVIRGFPLHSAPDWLAVVLILVVGSIAPIIGLRRGPLVAIGGAVAGGALYAALTQVSFRSGLILPLIYPLEALALQATGTLATQYVATSYERERVRDLFARFVPEQVVDQVLARSEELRLGGELIDGTVLFSDLRGFTTFSETRPAAQVLEVLNEYLTVMGNAILDNGGTLTAYLGDGIMALFGGPLAQLDHADRALEAACAMLSRLEEFNAWVREAGLGDGFRVGIGLNTGAVMVGTVGSERRLEYTAIGDAVNTASRIEGLTKGTPHQLFVSESTRVAMTRAGGDLVEVGELAVRGRQRSVRVWTLDDVSPDPAKP